MIRITKDGFKSLEWNKDTRDYKEIVFNPIRALRYSIDSIAEDVTIGNIFEFVHNDDFLSVFMSEYSSCPVKDFYDALQSCAKGPTTMHYAEVALTCTLMHRERDKQNDIEYGWDLHGIGPLDSDEKYNGGRKKGDIIHNWSISELPVEQLAVLPIRIGKMGDFRTYNYPPGSEGHTEDTFEAGWISLLEFLDTVLYDISFNGGPKDREKFMEHLNEMVKEIEDGTAKTVPFDFDKDEQE